MRAGRRRGFRPSHRESEGHVYRAVLHRVDEKPLGTPGGHKYRNDGFLFLQGLWDVKVAGYTRLLTSTKHDSFHGSFKVCPTKRQRVQLPGVDGIVSN